MFFESKDIWRTIDSKTVLLFNATKSEEESSSATVRIRTDSIRSRKDKVMSIIDESLEDLLAFENMMNDEHEIVDDAVTPAIKAELSRYQVL